MKISSSVISYPIVFSPLMNSVLQLLPLQSPKKLTIATVKEETAPYFTIDTSPCVLPSSTPSLTGSKVVMLPIFS